MKKKSLAEEAQSIVDYWKPRLRLQNWKIEVKIAEDVKEIGCFAINRQDPNYEEATIELLNPEKIPSDWRGCKDMEVTLVHELMHTRLIYVAVRPGRKKKKDWQVEMAVETVAKALVAAKRGVDPDDIE